MKRTRNRMWWPAVELEPFPDLGLTAADLLAELDPGYAAWIGGGALSEAVLGTFDLDREAA